MTFFSLFLAGFAFLWIPMFLLLALCTIDDDRKVLPTLFLVIAVAIGFHAATTVLLPISGVLLSISIASLVTYTVRQVAKDLQARTA